jgi:hypothetical protein
MPYIHGQIMTCILINPPNHAKEDFRKNEQIRDFLLRVCRAKPVASLRDVLLDLLPLLIWPLLSVREHQKGTNPQETGTDD